MNYLEQEIATEIGDFEKLLSRECDSNMILPKELVKLVLKELKPGKKAKENLDRFKKRRELFVTGTQEEKIISSLKEAV